MKKKLLIGVLVSGVFLYLAVRDIDWEAFAAAFSEIDYMDVALAVVFTMLGHFSRSIRWRFMMNPVKRIDIGPLWAATAIAFMVNNLLPARVGEIARAYVIGRSEDVSKSAAFATVVYERVVDVFVLIVLLWYCLLTIHGPDWLGRSALLLVLFNVLLLAALVAVAVNQEGFLGLVRRMTGVLPGRFRDRVFYSLEGFVGGLGVVTQFRSALPIAILSVAVWGFATLGVYFCVLALGMQVPFAASIFLIVVISLGSMIPSAPAFIGTMQYACIIALSVYGIERPAALAYSTVYHATQFFPITIVGLWYAARMEFRVSDISRSN